MKAPTIDPVLSDLLTARERLTNGWCKFALHLTPSSVQYRMNKPVGKGPDYYCLFGSFNDCSKNALPNWQEVRNLIQGVIGDRNIAQFNNDSRTTHADVLAVVDEAIAQRVAA